MGEKGRECLTRYDNLAIAKKTGNKKVITLDKEFFGGKRVMGQ